MRQEVIENKVYVTIGTVGLIYLIACCKTGSISNIFEQNDFHPKQNVVNGQVNKIESSSTIVGISRNITKYTDNKLYVENNMNNENIRRLNEIRSLKDGWDGNNARPFDLALIEKVHSIVSLLNVQPEIFPTACDSIQIEYENGKEEYLEFEISDAKMAKCYMIDISGQEKTFTVEANDKEINKVLDKFYGQQI